MKNREYLNMLLSTKKKEADLLSYINTVHPALLSIDYVLRLDAYLTWKNQEIDRVTQELDREFAQKCRALYLSLTEERCFLDESFFHATMRGRVSVLETFLQTLMGDEKLKLDSAQIQWRLDVSDKYNSVVVDARCESEDGRIFAIELPKGEEDECATRALFDGYAIGMSSLYWDQKYEDLRPTYVICPTDHDVFGTGEFIHWEKMLSFDPRFHTIFLNCSYAFDRINEKIEQATLLFKLEHEEIGKADREKVEQRIIELRGREADQAEKMKAETAKYGITEKTWRELLVYGHDFKTKDWHDIQRQDLAELMRLAKEPNAGEESLLSAELNKMLEEKHEETRREAQLEDWLEFARWLLANNIGADIISDVTWLPRDVVLKLTP